MFWDNTTFWDASMWTDPYFYVGTFIMMLICYFIGSINAGQLLSLLGSKDLGAEGSKSYGATNAGRIYGKSAFIGVFIFDMLKALFAALILSLMVDNSGTPDVHNMFYNASVPIALFFVVIGHSWPLYFKFKGGKGVATSFGLVITVNWLFAIIAILVFLTVILTVRRTGIASVIGTTVGVILVVFLQPFMPSFLVFNWSMTWMVIPVAIALGVLVTIRHRSNLMEVITGEVPLVKPRTNKEDKQ